MGNGNTDVVEKKDQYGRFRLFLLALVAGLGVPGVWAAEPKIAFNIPASEFPQAIVEFYKQSQIEILYASLGSLSEIKTRAVVGQLDVREALKRMLEGTGFTFEFENARSVLVKRAKEAGSTTVSTVTQAVMKAASDAMVETARAAEIRPEIPEVVVTGSFIRGLKDIVSPLIVVDEREKRAAAYASVQDVLRTLPVVFGGGASEDIPMAGNFNRGAGINLRGLGNDATLVLVNGRRQPVSGTEGDFVDVSMIPWSMVDRIEVLPDGSSALYGSDAIAGVVNIILRQDLEGAEGQTRLTTSRGGANETLAAFLFAPHFGETGKAVFAYQYSERGALAASDRVYAANSDKRPLGGTDLSSFRSNPGNILNPATLEPAFAIPSGQDGTALSPGDLLPGVVNLQNPTQGYDLLPYRRIHSFSLSASQELGEHFSWFTEGRFSQRHSEKQQYVLEQMLVVPDSNPFFVEPFGGLPFVLIAYNFLDDLGPFHDVGETQNFTGTVGLKAKLHKDWQATIAASYTDERMLWTGYNIVDPFALDAALADTNPATAFNPFGAGSHTNPETLESIRSTQRETVDSTLAELNLIADGSFVDLPAGETKLAMGFDYRREGLYRKTEEFHNLVVISGQYDRQVSALFAELAAPITSKLQLSLAERYERYNDFGSALSPKLGLHWSPLKSLRFRGSWGTSFKAPTLVNLYDTSQSGALLVSLPDPLSSSGQSVVLARQGNNEQLRQETASTWTVGIDFAPAAVPGLTIASSYFVVEYKDRAWRPDQSIAVDSLLADDRWASLITRNPSRAEIDAICGGPYFFGSIADCATNPPSAIVDVRVRNLSTTISKGVDVELHQLLDSGYGSFRFGIAGSYLFRFAQAFTPTSPLIDLADTVNNPAALRLRATAGWHQHRENLPGFGVNISMERTGGYQDPESLPMREVVTSTTFDLLLNYRTPKSRSFLSDVEFTLSAVNVFDKDPPFVNRAFGYDLGNAKPYGRVLSFYLQKNW